MKNVAIITPLRETEGDFLKTEHQMKQLQASMTEGLVISSYFFTDGHNPKKWFQDKEWLKQSTYVNKIDCLIYSCYFCISVHTFFYCRLSICYQENQDEISECQPVCLCILMVSQDKLALRAKDSSMHQITRRW